MKIKQRRNRKVYLSMYSKISCSYRHTLVKSYRYYIIHTFTAFRSVFDKQEQHTIRKANFYIANDAILYNQTQMDCIRKKFWFWIVSNVNYSLEFYTVFLLDIRWSWYQHKDSYNKVFRWWNIKIILVKEN